MKILNEAISELFLLIDSALYQAVAWLYNLFLKLAEAEIFTSDIYENFAQRIYIILGVVMLFVLAYSLLQAIVNPDNFFKGDKSFSKVAMNFVIALIIIGILPTVFDYSRKLQNFILDSNLIGTMMFGGDTMEVDICDENGANCHKEFLSASEVAKARIDTYGNVMAFTTLNAFLNPQNYNITYNASDYLGQHGLINPFSVVSCIVGVGGTGFIAFATGGVAALPSFATLVVPVCTGSGKVGNFVADKVADVKNYTWNDIRLSILLNENGGFSQIISLTKPLKKGAKAEINGKVESIKLTYMPFVSSACACLLIYLLVSFCIDLGIRTVRLAFLQLMAPIPIFMKAMPGKGSQFEKWMKKTIATYLEVFIRIFLMYMVVYFLSNLQQNLNTREGLWVNVVIIMGLIAFVKEAPKLISEITGIDSGNMKLGIIPKLAAGGALAGAALVEGGTRSFLNNTTHAVKKGIQTWKDPNSTGFNKAGSIFKGLGSAAAGGVSGALRSGYAARSSKNIADARKGAQTGFQGAIDARDKRESYRITHQNDRFGVPGAQVKDFFQSVGHYVGIGDDVVKDSRAKEAASAIKNMISQMQAVWKDDEGWKKADEAASIAKGELYKLADYEAYLSHLKARKEAYLAGGGTEAAWNSTEKAVASADIMSTTMSMSTADATAFTNAINDYESKDATVKGIEKAIQSKKANQLAGQAKTVATYMEKYADMLPSIFGDDLAKLNSLDLAHMDESHLTQDVYDTLNKAKITSANAISDIERRDISRSKPNEKK